MTTPPESTAVESFDSIGEAASLERPVEGAVTSAAEAYAFDRAHIEEMLAGLKQDREERKRFSKLIFTLASAWLSAVMVLLVLQGFGSKYGFFNLNDRVLELLLGATMLKVLGLMWLVTSYLFDGRRIPPSSKTKTRGLLLRKSRRQ